MTITVTGSCTETISTYNLKIQVILTSFQELVAIYIAKSVYM
jgi:hypothetical protein